MFVFDTHPLFIAPFVQALAVYVTPGPAFADPVKDTTVNDPDIGPNPSVGPLGGAVNCTVAIVGPAGGDVEPA